MNITLPSYQSYITCRSISNNYSLSFDGTPTSQSIRIWSSALLPLLKLFLFVILYVCPNEYLVEFESVRRKILPNVLGKYFIERTVTLCNSRKWRSVSGLLSVIVCFRTKPSHSVLLQNRNVVTEDSCSFRLLKKTYYKYIQYSKDYKVCLNVFASKRGESLSNGLDFWRLKPPYSVATKCHSELLNGSSTGIPQSERFQDQFKKNKSTNRLGNGVMQSSDHSFAVASSALYNAGFGEKNIFGHFSSLIGDFNFPLGEEFSGPQMTDTCSFSEKEHEVFNDVKDEKCVDMHMNEAKQEKEEAKIENNSLVNLENFKTDNWTSSDTRVPSKRDKTFLTPLPPPNKNLAAKHDRQDEFQIPTSQDYENENFTSVFTKSLTSLYSHDSETSYANDINMKCVVGGVTTRLDEGEFSSDSIESKSGTNKLRSDSISDQSFDSAFHIVEKPPIDTALNLHNLQTENGNMFSSDSDSGCDGKKVQDEMNAKATALTCFRYEPYELPNAFSTKPDAESEFSLGSNNQDSTFLSIGESSDSFSQEKPIGFNLPSFQWKRSNFTSGLRQSSVRGRLDSRNQSYSTRKLLLVNQRKGHIISNKTLRSVRGRRSRTVRDENSPKPVSEKPHMKISALSVYATVQDGVVLSVKCKRYKRRSEKYYNKNGEKILNDQNFEPNTFLDTPVTLDGSCNAEEVFEDDDHAAKLQATDTTTKAVETSSNERQIITDIHQLSNDEFRELVAKLCLDYSLDLRDFDDPDQIKEVSVIDDTEEAQVRRGRPRRAPTAEQEGSESESSSVDNSRSSFKESSDIKDTAGSHRILRSLPCRRSPRTLKNGAKGVSTHRYCTRNAENQMSADDSNIGGELSESDKSVCLTQEINNSVVKNEHGLQISAKEASQSSCQELLTDDNGRAIPRGHTVQSELLSSSGSCSISDVPPEYEIKSENKHNINQECLDNQQKAATLFDNSGGACLEVKQRNSEPVPCQVAISKEPYLKDHALREPPSLVKVEKEDAFYNLDKESEESVNNMHDDRLSPRYLVADNILPRPDNPSDQNSSQTRYAFGNANTYCLPLEGSNNCLPTRGDQDRNEDKKTVQNMIGNHDPTMTNITGNVMVSEPPMFLKTPKCEPSASPVVEECVSQDNFDDDCIVISVDDDDGNESSRQTLGEPLEISPKKEFLEHHSKESDLPSMGSSEGMDLRLLKDLSPGTELTESKSSFLHKDERDESILRNLLLDSTDNMSTVPVSASSQDHSSPTPIITSVISLNGIKSISPSPPPQTHPDTLKRPSSVDSCSPFLSRSKYIKTMDMLPAHGHQGRENSRDMSHSSLGSPSRDEKCDLRRLLSNENVSPSYSPKPPTGDNRDPSWTKDPHQLKDNIKKLKNEIVYLQMMAEQKEKEKIAIVCFKRYKEEILKRMYKAYAYSLRNRLNEFLRPEDCTNDVRGPPNQSMMHSVQTNSVLQQPSSKYGEIMPPAPQRNLQYPSHCSDTNLQDPKMKLSPRHQRFSSPCDYSNGGAQRANYKLQISALESRRIPSYNDKLPAVESMVASASDNYGFDMRNVKESSEDRKSRLKASLANTILQKALASKESHAASMSEGVVNNSSSVRSYPLNKSCNYVPSHINMSNNSSASLPKRYPCENIPLDMAMSRVPLGKPAPNKFSTEMSGPYNGNTESSHPSLQMNTRSPKEGSSIQTLLKESRGRSATMIPTSMWTIPNGDNTNQDQMHENRKSEVKMEIASAQRRQVESIAAIPRQENFMMARPHLETSSASAPSAAPSKASVPVSHQRCIPSGKDGATLNGVLNRLYSRKLEEGRMKGYIAPSSASADSTAPYGGRLIKNESAVKSAPNSGSGTVNNNFGNGPLNSPRCMGCGLSDAKFLCSGCRKDWYCSPQCQSLRWPEHSQICAGRIYGHAPGSFS